MSFWKKLFNKAEGNPDSAPKTPFQKTGWAEFDFSSRQGRESVHVAYDPSFISGNDREAYSLCLRAVLYLPPNSQDVKGQPSSTMVPLVAKWESELIKRIVEVSMNALLVGRLQYQGCIEWVFMTDSGHDFREAIAQWKISLGDFPAVFAEESEGWGHYDTYLVPGKRERLLAEAKTKMEDLRQKGTNAEALHKLHHEFSGSVSQILALKSALEEAQYWIGKDSATELTAFKGIAFNWEAFQADILAVMTMAEKSGVEYKGWESPVIKRQLLAGNEKDGWGELMFAKGAVYSGNFVNGQMHGKGKMIYESGEWYEGDWDMGKRTGSGVYRWGKTEWYEGGFFEGKLQGQGTYFFANGNVYAGQWANDVREGIGKLNWKEGSVYVGEWKGGKRSGNGRLNYADPPEWVEGGFLDNKIHGDAVEFSAKDGKIIRRRFVEDRAVEVLKMPEVKSCWTWASGPQEPGPSSRISFSEHARNSHRDGKIPVAYFRNSNTPVGLQLSPYSMLPDIAHVLTPACILEIIDMSIEEKQNIGLPEDTVMAILDENGKPTGKTLGEAVWFTDRIEQAKSKLAYFLMP